VVQRFWLTVTSLGLQLQPEMTPLIFGRYVREGRVFSRLPGAMDMAGGLGNRLTGILGKDSVAKAVFLGRVGHGPEVTSRSLRLAMERLWTRG
jgi:hypothetical protein